MTVYEPLDPQEAAARLLDSGTVPEPEDPLRDDEPDEGADPAPQSSTWGPAIAWGCDRYNGVLGAAPPPLPIAPDERRALVRDVAPALDKHAPGALPLELVAIVTVVGVFLPKLVYVIQQGRRRRGRKAKDEERTRVSPVQGPEDDPQEREPQGAGPQGEQAAPSHGTEGTGVDLELDEQETFVDPLDELAAR